MWWLSPQFERWVAHIASDEGDANGRQEKHTRLELRAHPDDEFDAVLWEAACVHCGRTMRPFRRRQGQGAIYLSVSCEQDVRKDCSRGRDAARAYTAIERLIRETKEGKQ